MSTTAATFSSRLRSDCLIFWHSLVLALVFVVMLSRALVPEGWMPNLATNGTTITICSPGGPRDITLDSSGKPIQPAHSQSHHLCPFAVTAHLNLSPSALIVHAQPVYFSPAVFFLQEFRQRSTFRNAHTPRAPPAAL